LARTSRENACSEKCRKRQAVIRGRRWEKENPEKRRANAKNYRKKRSSDPDRMERVRKKGREEYWRDPEKMRSKNSKRYRVKSAVISAVRSLGINLGEI
jgi:hypothetical protein